MSDEITAKFGYTINMGNYESCRLDIGITKSKGTTEQEEDEMLDAAFNLLGKLEKKLMPKVEELEEKA